MDNKKEYYCMQWDKLTFEEKYIIKFIWWIHGYKVIHSEKPNIAHVLWR